MASAGNMTPEKNGWLRKHDSVPPENRMDDVTDFMATVDIVSSLRMVGFACGDVFSATFLTTVRKPKMIDISEQTIALVVDSDDNLSKDDGAGGSSTYRDRFAGEYVLHVMLPYDCQREHVRGWICL